MPGLSWEHKNRDDHLPLRPMDRALPAKDRGAYPSLLAKSEMRLADFEMRQAKVDEFGQDASYHDGRVKYGFADTH